MEPTLILTPNADDLYTLVNNETACHPFEAVDDAATLVTFFHSMYRQRQDFSVRVWFSDEPNGEPPDAMPQILHRMHPLLMPYKFYFYADAADVTESETGWDAEFIDLPRFDLEIQRRKKRVYPDHVSVATGRIGTYWINFRNLVASDNGYFLHITPAALVE